MIIGREICSAIEWLALRREKSGERPSALSTDRTHGDLIATVDIGTFITIHFYWDKSLVYDLRDFWVVIGFAIHDMAPVTPDRANVEQDRLILPLRFSECFFTPLVPPDGLMHGRTQVRRSGFGKGVEGLGRHVFKCTGASE